MADALDICADTLLAAACAQVPQYGWTSAALHTACKTLNLPVGTAALVFPRGALDALDRMAAQADIEAVNRLTNTDLASLRVHERIHLALMTRLAVDLRQPEVCRRAIGRLLLPDAFGVAPRLAARTADALWRAVGDRSLDENYYSKRALLAGVWSQVLLAGLSDGTNAAADVATRRLQDILAFGQFKQRLPKSDLPKLMARLGRWRYSAQS